jgi:hypothetical protein
LPTIETPHRGIKVWRNALGADVLRLHYTADEDKDEAWADAQRAGTSPEAFRQECDIDFSAKSGQRLFTFTEHEHAILEKRFPIPSEWTRYYDLDPHPRVPHAHLWCAVDPYGDRWYYREFWPSKQYGIPGNIPEDDNRYTIKEHMEIVRWMESADHPDNSGKEEQIYRRVIDYAARSFGQGTSDDAEPQENFQLRFERTMRDLRMQRPYFQDAIKDRDAGIDRVNQGFKPFKVEKNGAWVDKARIHIFDDLVELIYQLRTNRYPQLTALQADRQDPISSPMQKRNHQTDLLRYLEMAEPKFVQQGKLQSNWTPIESGVNY